MATLTYAYTDSTAVVGPLALRSEPGTYDPVSYTHLDVYKRQVLTGAVASGQLGAVAWAIALPLLAGRLVMWWQDGEPSWPVVGGVGLAATVMTAAEPLTWVAVVAAVGVLAWRLRHGWIRPAVAAVSPLLLLVTPFTAELARFPGRLLTGTEPLLVPTNAMSRIELLLGRAAPEAAPVWVAAATLGVIWLLALTGAVLNLSLIHI